MVGATPTNTSRRVFILYEEPINSGTAYHTGAAQPVIVSAVNFLQSKSHVRQATFKILWPFHLFVCCIEGSAIGTVEVKTVCWQLSLAVMYD